MIYSGIREIKSIHTYIQQGWFQRWSIKENVYVFVFSKVNQISFSGNKILIIFAWFYEGGGFNDQQRFSLDPLNEI